MWKYVAQKPLGTQAPGLSAQRCHVLISSQTNQKQG